MKSYRLSDPARADIAEAWYYIAKDDARMADLWLDQLDRQIDLLTQKQKVGRLRAELGAGIRRILSTYRNLPSQFKGDA